LIRPLRTGQSAHRAVARSICAAAPWGACPPARWHLLGGERGSCADAVHHPPRGAPCRSCPKLFAGRGAAPLPDTGRGLGALVLPRLLCPSRIRAFVTGDRLSETSETSGTSGTRTGSAAWLTPPTTRPLRAGSPIRRCAGPVGNGSVRGSSSRRPAWAPGT